MTAKTVVILRPPEESVEIAAEIELLGLKPLIQPVLSIDYLAVDYPLLSDETPLIFTSANGVRAFAQNNERRSHPVYTVGRNTADEARQAGFTKIESAFGDAEDLVELLTGALKTDLIPPFYVRGEDISANLKEILQKKGLNIGEIVAYKAHSVDSLSINLLKALDSREILAIMAFSVRGGQVFAELAEQYGRVPRMKTIKALCMSNAVLESLSSLPFQEGIVADKPDRYGMIGLLKRFT